MHRRGLTLAEILIGLSLLGVLAHLAFVPLRAQLDWIALRSAREEVIAAFHRARMEARRTGASRLVLSEEADPELSVAGWPETHRVPLEARGIDLEVAGSRTRLEVEYGPLGIAQMASATLVFRRGSLKSALVVSGYGRVRR